MKIKISDNWKFIDNFDNSYLKKKPAKLEKIELPHTTKELPYNYFDEEEYQKVSTYFRDINLKEDDIKNKNLFLKFDGIMLKARVIFNNHDFGNFISGFMPFQIDITKYAKIGVNSLIVVVDSREDKTIPPFGNIVDYLTFGGIYRDVFLLIKPKKYISNLYCNGDMHGNLNISYTLSDNVTANYTLTYELYFDKKLIQSFVNSETIVENAKLWSPEHPNLYTLKATLNDENITDEMEVKFGFRSVKFTKKGFYLNQKPIKLIGLNRHQAYPYVGYAMPRSAQEDDAILLKNEIGVNVVRCSHYPPSDYFLDKCDEIGLMVFDEVPGWQFVSSDKIWRDNFYDFIERMVLKDRQFTSIIAYGVRIDESKDDHELYQKANEIVHNLNPYIPTTGVRNFKGSECLEDFYSYNDFSSNDLTHGLDKPNFRKTGDKPMMVTEFMGHMKPTKPFDSYPKRLETTLRYAKIIEDTYKYKNLCGSIGWCAFDYNTHKEFGSGDKICYHGVYDMFRNSKYTSSIYKAQQENYPYLEILTPLQPGDNPVDIIGNIYIATNADFIKMFKNDVEINSFLPDRKVYKYTPHPLIKINDLVGDRVDEKMTPKDKERLKYCLNFASLQGYVKKNIKFYYNAALLIMHNHIKIDEIYALYGKYMTMYPTKDTTYTVKAYKNGKEVASKTLGVSNEFHLEVIPSSNQIKLEGSYEVSRVSIKYLDQYNTLMSFCFLPISLECEGVISVIGPKQISFVGGQISTYVKASKKGKGVLHIKCKDMEEKINFIVK